MVMGVRVEGGHREGGAIVGVRGRVLRSLDAGLRRES